jgi:hypothetical protein
MLEKRIEKLEDALTPPGRGITVIRHECETGDDIRRRARKALGADPHRGDILYIVQVPHYGPCPPGRHVHEDAVQVWPIRER